MVPIEPKFKGTGLDRNPNEDSRIAVKSPAGKYRQQPTIADISK